MHPPLACINARGMADQPERMLCAAARPLLRASVVHYTLIDVMPCIATARRMYCNLQKEEDLQLKDAQRHVHVVIACRLLAS